MKTTEQKFKQGDRVLTPDGPGTIFEHCLGFYSVEVDGYRHDKYYQENQLIPIEQ
jgi:hypothetical protein